MTASNPTPGPTAEEVLERHVPDWNGGVPIPDCAYCGRTFPCDAAQMATALLKATEAIDIERIIASDGISEHDGIEHRMTQALAAITDTLGGTDE